MEKRDLQVVPGTENGPETNNLNPFTPENLRLDQTFTEMAAVKKLLTTIPVRVPHSQMFFRVHPSPDYRGIFPIITLKDEGEEYIVTKGVQAEIADEFVPKQLCLAASRQSTFFFLPLRMPGPDGKDMEWWRSLREHAEYAQKHWIKIKANRELGAYEAPCSRSSRYSRRSFLWFMAMPSRLSRIWSRR